MLRYLRRLADLDIALDRSMIPLGSCTMKLNAAAEMEAITWPEFAEMHPFAPPAQAAGYLELIRDLEAALTEITGYAAVSVQPNAGSQGELAGLLAIRAYHRSRSEPERNVCLIPESAHGTNAASAVLAGLRVVVVKCGSDGAIDLGDLRREAGRARGHDRGDHADLPVHQWRVRGDRQQRVRRRARRRRPGLRRWREPECAGRAGPAGQLRRRRVAPEPAQDLLHPAWRRRSGRRPGRGAGAPGPVPARSPDAGGASGPAVGQPGWSSPDEASPAGADGPAGADSPGGPVGPVAAAPYGSAGILPISWAYIRMMGADGLREATQVAILSANYIAARVGPPSPCSTPAAAG